MAMLRTEKGLPLAVGDRFILRDTGRRLVVAGGRVLDPGPGSTMSALSRATEIDPSGEPDVIATSLLRIRRTALQRDLEADSGGGTPVEGDQVGAIWLADGVLEGLEERAVELVAGDHREHPLRVGIKASTLARRLGVAQEVVERVVGESRRLERREAEVSLAGREVEIPPDIAAERDRVLARLDTGLEVPTVDQLGTDPELVHMLARTGQVVRVSSDLVLLPEQAEEIRRVVTELPDGFTIADFRERTGISRKYIVPYLEWTDAIGLTARRGDARWVR
jgi:selenocysteine-specific elongation factor